MSTPGEQLRAAREARGLTLEDVERATRIRAKYLAALENDDVQTIASPAQARGFLKNYAEHLGLNSADVLAQALPTTHKPIVAPGAILPNPKAQPHPLRPPAPGSHHTAHPSARRALHRACGPW